FSRRASLAPPASHKAGSAARASYGCASCAAQKSANFAPEGLEVDQKGVVPLDAWERREARGNACGPERARDGLLLAHREQHIRLHADHERGAQAGAPQHAHRLAVRAE